MEPLRGCLVRRYVRESPPGMHHHLQQIIAVVDDFPLVSCDSMRVLCSRSHSDAGSQLRIMLA